MNLCNLFSNQKGSEFAKLLFKVMMKSMIVDLPKKCPVKPVCVLILILESNLFVIHVLDNNKSTKCTYWSKINSAYSAECAVLPENKNDEGKDVMVLAYRLRAHTKCANQSTKETCPNLNEDKISILKSKCKLLFFVWIHTKNKPITITNNNSFK